MNIFFLVSCVLSIVVICVGGTYFKTKKELLKTSNELLQVKNQIKNLSDTDNLYNQLLTDEIRLEVGKGLLSIVDPRQDGRLMYQITAMRQSLTDELGYIIPNIKVCDSEDLGKNEFAIYIHNIVVKSDEAYPDRFVTIIGDYEKNNQNVPKDKITSKGFYNEECCWITKDDAQNISESILCTPPERYILSYLKETVIEYVNDILTIKDINKYIDKVRNNYSSEVADDVLSVISSSTIRQILSNLIREKVSVKDIGFIFDKLSEYVKFSQEAYILSERIRAALGQQIVNKNTVYNTLFAVTLSEEWEKLLEEAVQTTELGQMFMLSPHQIQQLLENTGKVFTESYEKINRIPVILCAPKIRLPLFQLLVRHMPYITVISYAELTTAIKVERVDII